ncbi:MAG TPA: RagB/SusD family nutrient uptake outer membrane protein, partial [Niastella sp.]|nr:RagB/SusD family nutrient uptake outer membrane protein [Niastella sp.]
MKRIYYFLIATAVLTGAASCKKDFMDLKPQDAYSDEVVWQDPALIQTFVNNLYLGIPHGFSNIMMSSMVDETTYNADFGSSSVTKSQVSPSDYSIFDEGYWTGNRQRMMGWSMVYKFIRPANIFFEKIDAAPFTNEEDRERMKGEAHFLRAYMYHNLVSMYGGVPIITKSFGLTDDFKVTRNTYEECINFIVSELDSAAQSLPLSYSGANKGRATKGAALALKSRVLLYAASDLYNTNASWAGSYANKELVGYVGGDRQARWKAAMDAAKAVMDLGVYNLYMPNPASATEASKNYSDIFLQRETSEDIFLRYFTAKIDENWDGYNPGLYNNPNGWHGWGSNTPIGQMVDAYEMKDGTKFKWNASDTVWSASNTYKPYLDRDPRFYASILYDGAKWRPRQSDAVGRDPIGIVQTSYAEKPDGTLVPGLDTRNGPLEDWNGTYTGYYMRKFIDPSVNAQYDKQEQPWRYIRYTEVLMNYAEAAIALGMEVEGKAVLNQIRKRAFMPDITEIGTALVERYRNERRVELAFEDQRYFDVRRWMIAPQAYESAYGVRPEHKIDNSGAILSSRYILYYGQSDNRKAVQPREWNPRFYL